MQGDSDRLFSLLESGSGGPSECVGYYTLFSPFDGFLGDLSWPEDPRFEEERKAKEAERRAWFTKTNILWDAYEDRKKRAESAIKVGSVKAGLVKVPGELKERRQYNIILSKDMSWTSFNVAYVGSKKDLQGRPFYMPKEEEFFNSKYSTIVDYNTLEKFKVPTTDLEMVGMTYILS